MRATGVAVCMKHKHRALADGKPHSVETGWTETFIVCRKCSKKLSGGYGPDRREPFKRALRTALRAIGRRGQVGILEVGCLGICPKGAVTTARSGNPGRLEIVPVGTPLEDLLRVETS